MRAAAADAMIKGMARPSRRRLNRFRILVLTAVTIMQVPTVSWLVLTTHSLLPVALALIVSLPYLQRLRSPWEPGPRLPMYLALVWWTTCFVFDVLLLIAVVAIHFGAPAGPTHALAGVIALTAGLMSVSGTTRLVRRTVWIADLPAELDGYRIGQLSDIHCGRDTPPERVARWVSRMNSLDLDLVAVTGDLITSGPQYVDAVARALGELRARDGVFACMGNHDYFTDGEHLVNSLQRHDLVVLRNRGLTIRNLLHVAGVDDTWTSRNDTAAALSERPPNTPVLLLAHDPNLFDEAVEHEVDLMLSGHTHGGQLAVPGFRHLSLARFITRFTAGLYRRGKTWLYVNRGAGTTGPPVRLGAPAELTVLTLRRAH